MIDKATADQLVLKAREEYNLVRDKQMERVRLLQKEHELEIQRLYVEFAVETGPLSREH